MQAKSGKNNGPFHWLEKRLWRSGVQDPMIREILCWQLSVIALSLFFGAVLWPFHPAGAWIFWFGFGALLSAWNFFALLKFVPKVISAGWSKSSLFALLLRTNMRLLFTGILLYMVLVWFKGSISAVLLGLAVLLVGMTAGGLKKALKKPAWQATESPRKPHLCFIRFPQPIIEPIPVGMKTGVFATLGDAFFGRIVRVNDI